MVLRIVLNRAIFENVVTSTLITMPRLKRPSRRLRPAARRYPERDDPRKLR